jgi:hypothetical protein
MMVLLLGLAYATITLDNPLRVGTESAITVVDDLSRPVVGAPVRATYRLGLGDEREVAVGLTDARGMVYWTPTVGGPVALRAREHRETAHIERASAPTTEAVMLSLFTTLILAITLLSLWPDRRREASR